MAGVLFMSREEVFANLMKKASTQTKRYTTTTEQNNKAVILSYRDFLDIRTMSKPGSAEHMAYLKRYNLVGNLLSSFSIDWNRPVLFFASEDISRELFLVGMMYRKRLSTYFLTNVIEIVDIYWGNRKRENMHLAEDDMYYSEQDIRQDVLAVYGDTSMGTWKRPESLFTTISSRINRGIRENKELGNWVFFRGRKSSLRLQQGFDLTFSHFESMRSQGYQIVDLMSSSLWPAVESAYQIYTQSGDYVALDYTIAPPLPEYIPDERCKEGYKDDESEINREREMNSQRREQMYRSRDSQSDSIDSIY